MTETSKKTKEVDETKETENKNESNTPEPNINVSTAFIIAIVGSNKSPDGKIDDRARGQVIAQPIPEGNIIHLGDELVALVEHTANSNDLMVGSQSLLDAIRAQRISGETAMQILMTLQQAQTGVSIANANQMPQVKNKM